MFKKYFTASALLLSAVYLLSGFNRIEVQTTDLIEATTIEYVEYFYPLWFTYQQSQKSQNQLFGPDKMNHEYGSVVAPNDDTLYASSFINLKEEPIILTIPRTIVTSSVLALDVYGNVFKTGIETGTPGTYALVGPDWTGTVPLPAEVTPIKVPVMLSNWIIRVDKYSPNGRDEREAAAAFRTSLRATTLSHYLKDPNEGAPDILPVSPTFSRQTKVEADHLMTYDPITFLKQLQTAVMDASTPPMNTSEKILSNKFDLLFGNGESNTSVFSEAVRKARAQIVNTYLSNEGPTNWITFINIGAWGDDYINRAAITEYIQYGNNHDAAAYYQAFKDKNGNLLDARLSPVYVLTFPKDELPEAKRFWSVTAYVRESITLVENPLEKYLIASYTPGLETNADGSISIFMSPTQPDGVAQANWLPVPHGLFTVLLRVYGPEGSVEDNTYVPPGITAGNL